MFFRRLFNFLCLYPTTKEKSCTNLAHRCKSYLVIHIVALHKIKICICQGVMNLAEDCYDYRLAIWKCCGVGGCEDQSSYHLLPRILVDKVFLIRVNLLPIPIYLFF